MATFLFGHTVTSGLGFRSRLLCALALLFVAAACGQGAPVEEPSSDPTADPTAVARTRAGAAAPTADSRTTTGQPTLEPTGVPPGPSLVEETGPPSWRYVNSGWVEPVDGESVGAFTQELRAFVITSQEEFDAFNAGFTPLRTRGTAASLARIEFEDSVLLAAYFLWWPVQCDPLSVVGFSVESDRASVDLEMEDDPQGRPRPYLLAPMVIAAVERSLFTTPGPVESSFEINGEPAATVTASP